MKKTNWTKKRTGATGFFVLTFTTRSKVINNEAKTNQAR